MLEPGIRIISDVHIWGRMDPLYRRLTNWMRDCPVQTLVFLGDIFDVMVGSHEAYRKAYPEFFELLNSLANKGVEIHYFEGNHDFHMSGLVMGKKGLHYRRSEFFLNVAGKKFFLCHGDLADKHDWNYRILRFVLRSWPVHALIQSVPVEWVLAVGKKMSRYSRDADPVLIENLPLQRRSEIRTLYRNYSVEKIKSGFDFVVMGHCHDADELGIRIGERSGFYINVGFPRVHQCFIEWTPADTFPRRVRLEF